MNFESYSDLEKEIQRFQSELAHLDDVQQQLDSSNLTDQEKASEQESITRNRENNQAALDNLINIQNAYNTYLYSVEQIQRINPETASSRQTAEMMISTLQNQIIEARKVLPESLQKEIRDRFASQANENTPTQENTNVEELDTESVQDTVNGPTTNYQEEYNKIEQEFNELLDGKNLSEIGYNDFDELINNIEELNSRRNKVLESIDSNRSQMEENELRDLLNYNHDLQSKIEDKLQEVKEEKERKEKLKEEKEQEIKNLEDKIKFEKEQIDTCENIINQIKGNPMFDKIVESYRDSIKKVQEQINKDEKNLEELKDDLKIILEGGELKVKDELDEIMDEALNQEGNITNTNDTVESTETIEGPKPGESNHENITPVNHEAGPTTSTRVNPENEHREEPPVVKPNTLKGLVEKGVLPRNLSESDLLSICNGLNIRIDGPDTVLTSEQIGRLRSDHEIERAFLNQRISDRNNRKIQEYDKLIGKYETILKDSGKLSPEYVEKVEMLLDKTKSEREMFVSRNAKITSLDRSEVVKGLSTIKDGSLDEKASNVNDKLRSEYEKLDELREEREQASSKFKQRRQDARIKRTLDRIEKLKSKKSKIASKQTQIVNKNSEAYISRMNKKIRRQTSKQQRVSDSYARISEANQRLSNNNMEQQRVNFDRENETRLFDRIGLAMESGRLQREEHKLESEIRRAENSVGRLR